MPQIKQINSKNKAKSSKVLMRLLPLPIPQTKQNQPFYQQNHTSDQAKSIVPSAKE
jgi:hypothetical protein